MKFTINRQSFTELLNNATKAISNYTAIPILHNVQLEIKSDTLKVTSSDTDLTIVQSFTSSEDEPLTDTIDGAMSMPGRFLLNAIKKMSGGSVTIDNSKNPTRATVSSDRAHFHIPTRPADEFPKLPELDNPKKLTMSASDLINALKHTLFAASKEETRPILNGVNLLLRSPMVFNATDSHRLSIFQTNVKQIDNDLEKTSLNLPQDNLKRISNLLTKQPENSEVTLLIDPGNDQNQVKINFGNYQLYSRQLVGNYPEVDNLVPKESTTKLNIDRKELLGAIQRASLTAHSMKNLVVNLTLNPEKQTAKLSCPTTDSGNASTDEELVINNLTGEELKISFNPDFMTDALKAFNSDQILLIFNGSLRPILIINPEKADTFKHILTPIRTF